MGRAFFLVDLSLFAGQSGVEIQVFDLTHFTSITSVALPNVLGSPGRFIRWGHNGLAFVTDAGFVYLLSGSFVSSS